MSDVEIVRLLNELELDVDTVETLLNTISTRVRIQVQDPESGDFDFAAGDPFNFSPRSIAYEHAKIHDGKGFGVTHTFTTIAAGGTADILLQNPSGNFSHIRLYQFASTTAPGTVTLYEGTTFTDAGTALTEHNRRRSSSTTANLVVTHTPTVTANGTELETDLIAGERRVGGTARTTVQEWLLNQNEDYLIQYTNESNATADFVVFNIFWYEP